MSRTEEPGPEVAEGTGTGAADGGGTAADRFREGDSGRLAVGVLVAVALHFALLKAAPAFRVGGMEGGAGSMEAVELPPSVEVPPPPEQVARPATPTVAETDVSEEVTIAPTTFEANPSERLPPPPEAGAAGEEDRPTFIPRDVDPRLQNPGEVQEMLERHYPPPLRDAGIGGRVVLWVYVDEEGRVTRTQVQASSGYRAFDRAAVKVARQMEFRPAINRDRPIAVWVAQPVRFEVAG